MAKSQAVRSRKRPHRWLRATLAVGLWTSLLGALFVIGYLMYLDRTIIETFEGRRWSVPAVVYAQPLELFPGAAISRNDMVQELERVGYRQTADARTPGTFKRRGNSLTIYARAFRFMERNRSSQLLELRFANNRISKIVNNAGQPIPLVRLDPPTIGSFFPSHGEDRIVLTPEQVPTLLTDSLKAVEDKNFDHHAGFDLAGILRAVWVNLTSGELRQGGSTLTQQLVKSYYLDNRRTFERKLRELAMSVILDARFDKQDLLNAYVNEIFLGQDGGRAIHGFGLGAQFYFNKPLGELAAHEIATLLAVIRGPSYYNPYSHPERVLQRRDRVLGIMLQDGIIDATTFTIGTAAPLGIVEGDRRGGAYYPAYMDLVRSNLAEQYDDAMLASQGLRVFTTLVPRTQEAVAVGIQDALGRIETSRQLEPNTLQAAVVVTNTQTGEVLALAGGRHSGVDGYNRALNANRPTGSLLKPVVYLTAIESGYHLASLIDDAPISLRMSDTDTWSPQNFDFEAHGPVPLVRALGDSLNLATVRLGLQLGVDTVASRLQSLTGHAPANKYPSLLLGAESMTPLEVSALYGTFASGGFYMPPKAVIAVLNEAGVPVTHHTFSLSRRIEPATAAALNRALEVVMRTGTGRTSRFSKSGVAGKTGTSDDYRDSWYAGFDDTRLSVIWVGRDNNEPAGLTGAAGALQVWDSIMAELQVVPLTHLPVDNLYEVEYQTGLLARAGCADVVTVPIPDDAVLQAKTGCGITTQLSRRIRSWFRND